MEDKYWKEYYKSRKTPKESEFAREVAKITRGSLVDIGAGDRRDSKYFSSLGFKVTYIEPNGKEPTISAEELFGRNDIQYDVCYARWFIHAVEKPVENSLYRWASKNCRVIAIEARAIGDDSFVDDHYRRLINPNDVMTKLISLGFNIRSFKVGRGLSKTDESDPRLFRIIAVNSLMNNIETAKEIFERHDIPFILDGGSLLGAYRDGKAIDNDHDDVDFATRFDHIHKKEGIIKDFKKAGFSIVRERETMFTAQRGNSKVDLFFMREEGDNYYITLFWQKKPFGLFLPKRYFDDRGTIKFYHTELPCPQDIDGYLTHRYGNWRQPIIRPAFTFQNYIDSPITKWL